jgi:hypothetical protein
MSSGWHWNQPKEVLNHFEQSAVFVLNAGSAATAAGGLDGSSGDSYVYWSILIRTSPFWSVSIH